MNEAGSMGSVSNRGVPRDGHAGAADGLPDGSAVGIGVAVGPAMIEVADGGVGEDPPHPETSKAMARMETRPAREWLTGGG